MTGSPNQARMSVLSALADNGGSVSDPDGLAAGLLRDLTGYHTTRGLRYMLTAMQAEGLVVRHMESGRTMSVEITEGGRQWVAVRRRSGVVRVKGPAKPAGNSAPKRAPKAREPKPAPEPKKVYAFPENVPWEKLPVDHDEVCRSQARSMKWMDLAS